MELTPRITELYNSIQKGIKGRYAMWVQDAVAWYTLNKVEGDTLEIGTAFGGSAIIASKAKQDAGVNGLIYCVDPQDGTYGNDMQTQERATIEITTGNFDKFGVENIVIFQHRTPPAAIRSIWDDV